MSKSEIKKGYYENGNIKYECYYLNGKCHRDDGPAYIRYYEYINACVYYKQYYTNGVWNRINGPAVIFYYENGNLEHEHYYLNGTRHRDNGPAYIAYYPDGNVWYVYHYINGEVLTEDEWYQRLTVKQRVNLLYGKGNE